jgi:1,4-dihydroxy-2-naphthoate octaprenyltransferase
MRVEEINFWPLIPGAILIVVGFVVLAGTEAAESFELVWPILLIALGVVVLIAAVRGRGKGSSGGGPS